MGLMLLVKMTCLILLFTLFRFIEYIEARVRVASEASWRVRDRQGENSLPWVQLIQYLPRLQKWN
jgi:hypothetical protein